MLLFKWSIDVPSKNVETQKEKQYELKDLPLSQNACPKQNTSKVLAIVPHNF